MLRLREMREFVREARRKHFEVGAVLPSSRRLGRRIAAALSDLPPNARILEAGAGTGAVTAELLPRLRPGDTLALSELIESFCAHLRDRLDREPAWRAKAAQVTILPGDILQLPAAPRYHAIVCGLPFNNFPTALARSVMDKLLALLEPGGRLSYFEYLAIRNVKAMVSGRAERQRLAEVGALMAGYRRRLRESATPVLPNFPPAIIHHLRAPTS